ncbi:hypothetical protein [Paludisphaera mucosa]|uniref:DUF1963 domain-containing protein n=1 Tax=Paludisphaera mucosa TaxID=3030827 RepID=A0ABT6F5B8_9BACT|nr:hypothetical protein [Paludisphaera mucosa]MDG3002714.1 hypothetical protein [Paludisphaera mucosa]
MADSEATRRLGAILRALEEQGVRAAPVEEAVELGRSSPEAVFDLAAAVVDRFPDGGTFLDAALGYLPDDRWDGLVGLALDALDRDGENEAADAVIAHAGLQALPSLHGQLDRLFRLRPNAGTNYENWPWRESGDRDVEPQVRRIEDPGLADELRQKAWRILLETRSPGAVARALALANRVHPVVAGFGPEAGVEACLRQAGLTRDGAGIRRLAPDGLFHVVFPGGFFEQPRPPWLARVHPTWTLEPSPEFPPMRFGGRADGECPLCRGRLHRLIDLDPVPSDLGVTGLGRLEIATCLPCLGWELAPLFYHHAENGHAVGVAYHGPTIIPQFPAEALRESEVRLAVTPGRWRWQDWGLSNSRENLTRIGGEPGWIQDAEHPDCPTCGRVMGHLMQLDSDLPTGEGGEWLWGSGGIGFVSWCDRCKVSGHLWQCT